MTIPTMPSQPAATTTADTSSTKEDNDSITVEGPQCCRKRKRDEPQLPILQGHYMEVDENNIVRGIGIDPNRELEIAFTPTHQPTHKAVKTPLRKTGHNPIQWRSHSEVAIEVDEFKQAMVLHDLVDNNNVHLMVVTRDNAIIQGHCDQVTEMYVIVRESWGLGDKDQIVCQMCQVSGKESLLRRQKARKGGLVNIHHGYIPMDWKKAEQLMSKEFPRPSGKSLIVMEFRLADRSPHGNLKPGRRLVPIID
ncbi:hypothetical protein F4813DRAFT_357653 [Daldinia decipiens]|uniref:uncharacterized protein n=1 Tax=Daldinia decipiens TaxID=326647 RepID=UPI0020C4422B|nr:uncharacterized protein F4813DRAFT_357653 [Daldinia decipiens]KAI1658176.1 hypothetical protein F4813DRAFT_357653 [Daldinia decipiens]